MIWDYHRWTLLIDDQLWKVIHWWWRLGLVVYTFFKARPRSKPIDTSCSRDIWTAKTTTQNFHRWERESNVIECKRSSTKFALFKQSHLTVLTFLGDTEQFCMLSYRTAQCRDRAMMIKSRKRLRGDGQMSLSCLFAVVVRILLLLCVIGAIFRMLKMIR